MVLENCQNKPLSRRDWLFDLSVTGAMKHEYQMSKCQGIVASCSPWVMAVQLVRRKRTVAIVVLFCLLVILVLYKRSEQLAGANHPVHEEQRETRSRHAVETVTDREVTVQPTRAWYTKFYSVVPIELDYEEVENEPNENAEEMKRIKKDEVTKRQGEEVGVEDMSKSKTRLTEEQREIERLPTTMKNSMQSKQKRTMKEQQRKEGKEDGENTENKVKWEQNVDAVDKNGRRRTAAKDHSTEKITQQPSRDKKEIITAKITRQPSRDRKEIITAKKERGKQKYHGSEGNLKEEKQEVEDSRRNTFRKTNMKTNDERTNTAPSMLVSSTRSTLSVITQVPSPSVAKSAQPQPSVSTSGSVGNVLKPRQSTLSKYSNSVLGRISETVLSITRNNSTKTTESIKTTNFNNPRLKKTQTSSTRQPKTVQHSTTPAANAGDESLACKVPILDPYHPLVSSLLNNVGTDLRKRCRGMHPRTPAFHVVGNKLVLRHGINERRISRQSLKLNEIQRTSDSDFTYINQRNVFQGLESIRESRHIGKSDFFRLEYKIDDEFMSDLYARVAAKTDILEKQIQGMKKSEKKGLPLNVLIIGFDSTSRANFERKMGRVVSFLNTKLNTYVLNGMSVVGDATTPILTALLTGERETELPEGRRSYGGTYIDQWPWIMKDYEKQGYMTLFAEDDPSVSAFNLRLEGFKESPAHHYMRPFWLSLEREHERDEPGLCSKSESMTNFTLKYLRDFFDVYPRARKFAFGFMSYLAHAHPNHLSYAEDDLLWFLRTFVNKGYHKDTMVIIMGDHGSRNSEFRDTMQGKLEERLPWFSISLPSTFHRDFADLVANLRSNQKIISSSFDVHATLRHILTYPKVPSGEKTKSLFEKFARNRTCPDAGIDEHWCPCYKWSAVNTSSELVKKIGLAVVDHINAGLSKVSKLDSSCHRLKLDTIQDAVKLEANSKVQEFDSTDQDGDRSVRFGGRTMDLRRYQIIFNTQPNGGKYEATVSVSEDERAIKVNPEISRINRYNDQPKCIAREYPYARKFCFCRTSP